MCSLKLLLLVGSAYAIYLEPPPQQFDSTLNEGSYLGPYPQYQPPLEIPCQPSVVYHTKIHYLTQILPLPNNGQTNTYTETATNTVFFTVYSEIVSTTLYSEPYYITSTLSFTKEITQVKVIELPSQTQYLTHTSQVVTTQVKYSTYWETSVKIVESTSVIPVFSTLTVPKLIIRTISKDIIQPTTIVHTRTVWDTARKIDFSTVIVPGKTSVRSVTSTRPHFTTKFITKAESVITSTQVISVTSTSLSEIPVINTKILHSVRTTVQHTMSTTVHTKEVYEYSTKTITLPHKTTTTVTSTTVIPTTRYNKKIIYTTVSIPAQTEVRVVYRAVPKTKSVPGLTYYTNFRTRTIYTTDYVTSVVYAGPISTVYMTETVQNCISKPSLTFYSAW
ncbi:mucin-5AC-like [Macrobrachium nipponense]|uniref:mucin-5AC-like n=1 Tax=Macrobrachium nipponense TaxID=159736 RepID=UPI0030C8BEF1